MKRFKYFLLFYVFCPLAVVLVHFWRWITGCHSKTWENDIEYTGRGNGLYFVFHSQLLYVVMHWVEMYRRGLRGSAELSPSRDGEVLVRIIRMLGMRTIRGSARRKQYSSMKAIREELLAGRSVCLAVDGPMGPRGRIRDSLLRLAQETGKAIVPMRGVCRSEWRLNSWDRFRIPKPFSGVEIIYLEPVYVPPDAGPEEFERIKKQLREGMGETD